MHELTIDAEVPIAVRDHGGHGPDVLLLQAGVRGAFRSAVGADDATWTRARGRALSMALIALPYHRDAAPAFAAQARHTMEEAIAG